MRRFRVGDMVRVKDEWPKPFHPCAIEFRGCVGEIVEIIRLNKPGVMYRVEFPDKSKGLNVPGEGIYFYKNLELLEGYA